MTTGDVITLLMEVSRKLNEPAVKDTFGTTVIVFFVALTILQFSKIKVNPWSWVAKHVGRALNHDVIEEMKELHTEIDAVKVEQDKMRKDAARERVLQARRRILRSADEIRRGVQHSDEFFTEALADVDEYERYCKSHPNFENSKAENSIELIKQSHYASTVNNKFV